LKKNAFFYFFFVKMARRKKPSSEIVEVIEKIRNSETLIDAHEILISEDPFIISSILEHLNNNNRYFISIVWWAVCLFNSSNNENLVRLLKLIRSKWLVGSYEIGWEAYTFVSPFLNVRTDIENVRDIFWQDSTWAISWFSEEPKKIEIPLDERERNKKEEEKKKIIRAMIASYWDVQERQNSDLRHTLVKTLIENEVRQSEIDWQYMWLSIEQGAIKFYGMRTWLVLDDMPKINDLFKRLNRRDVAYFEEISGINRPVKDRCSLEQLNTWINTLLLWLSEDTLHTFEEAHNYLAWRWGFKYIFQSSIDDGRVTFLTCQDNDEDKAVEESNRETERTYSILIKKLIAERCEKWKIYELHRADKKKSFFRVWYDYSQVEIGTIAEVDPSYTKRRVWSIKKLLAWYNPKALLKEIAGAFDSSMWERVEQAVSDVIDLEVVEDVRLSWSDIIIKTTPLYVNKYYDSGRFQDDRDLKVNGRFENDYLIGRFNIILNTQNKSVLVKKQYSLSDPQCMHVSSRWVFCTWDFDQMMYSAAKEMDFITMVAATVEHLTTYNSQSPHQTLYWFLRHADVKRELKALEKEWFPLSRPITWFHLDINWAELPPAQAEAPRTDQSDELQF